MKGYVVDITQKTFNGNIPENIINKLSNVPNVFCEDVISEIEEEHDCL